MRSGVLALVFCSAFAAGYKLMLVLPDDKEETAQTAEKRMDFDKLRAFTPYGKRSIEDHVHFSLGKRKFYSMGKRGEAEDMETLLAAFGRLGKRGEEAEIVIRPTRGGARLDGDVDKRRLPFNPMGKRPYHNLAREEEDLQQLLSDWGGWNGKRGGADVDAELLIRPSTKEKRTSFQLRRLMKMGKRGESEEKRRLPFNPMGKRKIPFHPMGKRDSAEDIPLEEEKRKFYSMGKRQEETLTDETKPTEEKRKFYQMGKRGGEDEMDPFGMSLGKRNGGRLGLKCHMNGEGEVVCTLPRATSVYRLFGKRGGGEGRPLAKFLSGLQSLPETTDLKVYLLPDGSELDNFSRTRILLG